jgi:hypothetical protein
LGNKIDKNLKIFVEIDEVILSVIGYDDGEGRKRYALPRRARRFIYYVSIGSIS